MLERGGIVLKDVWNFIKRLSKHKAAIIGMVVIIGVIVMAIAAPLLAPYDPYSSSLQMRLSAPSSNHIFGTDSLGRDILSRCIYGSRVSLQVAVIAVFFGLFFGGLLGLLAGYFSGIWDTIIMRFMDALLALPAILIALVMIAALGPGLTNVMIAIGVSSIPFYARLTRGQVLSVISNDYVVSARALGGSDLWIMVRHIVPNILAPLIIFSTLRMASAIIIESTLSFLGLGIQPPVASWGVMVSDGRNYIMALPWMSLIPGLFIMITTLGFNLLGDGLRDTLDPRLRGEIAKR